VSFSAQNIKRKFPMILDRVNEVVRRTAKLGAKASIDVVSWQLLCCRLLFVTLSGRGLFKQHLVTRTGGMSCW
jgi:hypothetical protein